MNKKRLQLGMIGCGVVGTAVANLVSDTTLNSFNEIVGLKSILVKNPTKERTNLLMTQNFVSDINKIVEDDEITIVIELMGGENPAFDYISRCLKSGKHVITANKEVISKKGSELVSIAKHSGRELKYEASVGGGIPILSSLSNDFSANPIQGIRAIINGTTNYILTRMDNEESSFEDVLKDAQNLGYAESDPSDDIEGTDAVYKLSILTRLAFDVAPTTSDIHKEGINGIKQKEFRYSRELGFTIKLIASAQKRSDTLLLRVHPALIPKEIPMANVNGAFNMVEIDGGLTGPLWFQGAGAGPNPTASAVLSDLMSILEGRNTIDQTIVNNHTELLQLAPMDDYRCRYYLRVTVNDKPGVLAALATILGERDISILSVLQKDTDSKLKHADLVIMTHEAKEKNMKTAVSEIKGLSDVINLDSLLRVEEYS